MPSQHGRISACIFCWMFGVSPVETNPHVNNALTCRGGYSFAVRGKSDPNQKIDYFVSTNTLLLFQCEIDSNLSSLTARVEEPTSLDTGSAIARALHQRESHFWQKNFIYQPTPWRRPVLKFSPLRCLLCQVDGMNHTQKPCRK